MADGLVLLLMDRFACWPALVLDPAQGRGMGLGHRAHPVHTSCGGRPCKRLMAGPEISNSCQAKASTARPRQAASPQCAPTSPPSAAPKGRAPALPVRKMADTRPSRAPGVTVWRSVVELMVQMMAPQPNTKNPSPASAAEGHSTVAARVLQ